MSRIQIENVKIAFSCLQMASLICLIIRMLISLARVSTSVQSAIISKSFCIIRPIFFFFQIDYMKALTAVYVFLKHLNKVQRLFKHAKEGGFELEIFWTLSHGEGT